MIREKGAGCPDVHFVQSGSSIMTFALQSHDLRLGARLKSEKYGAFNTQSAVRRRILRRMNNYNWPKDSFGKLLPSYHELQLSYYCP